MKPISAKKFQKYESLFTQLFNNEQLSEKELSALTKYLSKFIKEYYKDPQSLKELPIEQTLLALKLTMSLVPSNERFSHLIFKIIEKRPDVLDQDIVHYQTGSITQAFKPMHLAVYFGLNLAQRNIFFVDKKLNQRYKEALNMPTTWVEVKEDGTIYTGVGMTPFLLALSQKKYQLALSIYDTTLLLKPNVFPESYDLEYHLNPFALALNHEPKLFQYMLENGYDSENKQTTQALYLAVHHAIIRFNQGDKTLLSSFIDSPSYNKLSVIYSLSAIQFAAIDCNTELLKSLLPAVRGSTSIPSSLKYLKYKQQPLLEVLINQAITKTQTNKKTPPTIEVIKLLIAAGLDVDDNRLNKIFGCGFFHKTTETEVKIRSLIKVGRLFGKDIEKYGNPPFPQLCLQANQLNAEYFNEIVMLSIGPNNVNQSITFVCERNSWSQYDRVLNHLLDLACNEASQHCLSDTNKTKLIAIVNNFCDINFNPLFQRAPAKSLVTLKQ